MRISTKPPESRQHFDIWQFATADKFDVDDKTVGTWLTEKRESAEFGNAPESRQHFDVWQFATADKGDGQQSHFRAVTNFGTLFPIL